MSRISRALWGLAAAGCLLLGCGNKEASVARPTSAAEAPPPVERQGPMSRIEPAPALSPERVGLGRDLFHDRRLSGNGKLSCSSCHDLTRAGVDNRAFSIGVTGEPVTVNTPTVFNSSLNFRQFWDGRALGLEEQIDGPLLNAAEMGSTWAKVLDAIKADAQLSARFAKAYPEGANATSVKDAIGTFERTLVTPDAPFDRFLTGDEKAINPLARRGYDLFLSFGCAACHQGSGVGGNMFQKLGIMGDYFADRGHQTPADQGRFNVTHDEADRHVFKVPSLRNVARTAPYLHDGSVASLDGVIRVMARYQLGRELEQADVDAIVAFLESLTGVYEGRTL